jgi:hypothetical protein
VSFYYRVTANLINERNNLSLYLKVNVHTFFSEKHEPFLDEVESIQTKGKNPKPGKILSWGSSMGDVIYFSLLIQETRSILDYVES